MPIRSLEIGDFPEVEVLIRNTIIGVNSKDYSDFIIQGMLTIDPYRPRDKYYEREYFVFEDTNIRGIIGIKNNEIKTFFIDINFRGTGIGKILLSYAQEKMINNGNKKSIVYSSISARSYYEKNGYSCIREDISDIRGEPMLRYYMEKDLIENHWTFGGDQELANRLITFVLSGQKTATTGLYLEDEVYGKVGEYAIIYDELTRKDLCIIQYTKVAIKPFLDVDFEYIQKEGEGDRDIESWRKSHRDFFEREYPEKFNDNSLVLCEEFRLIKKL